jgi:hypothetical protein
MATLPVVVTATTLSEIQYNFTPVVLFLPGVTGLLVNPITAPGPLYVDETGPAATDADESTFALQPGQSYSPPAGSTNSVWINSGFDNHVFSAIKFSPLVSSIPASSLLSDFPPTGLTTQTAIIPSYPYKQYEDDDDIQAFFASYNTIAQEYLNTVNALNLPIYTGSIINGKLLDWVGGGLYGYPRPTLTETKLTTVGPLNTWMLNGGPLYDSVIKIENATFITTTDDIYKRCLTWHVHKGDGKFFNMRWLKRRIMRFLYGTNGTSPPVDETYQISVSFSEPTNAPHTAVIRFIDYNTVVTGSCLLNNFMLNSSDALLNDCDILNSPLTPLPFRNEFKAAADSGSIELPFIYQWVVQI